MKLMQGRSSLIAHVSLKALITTISLSLVHHSGLLVLCSVGAQQGALLPRASILCQYPRSEYFVFLCCSTHGT